MNHLCYAYLRTNSKGLPHLDIRFELRCPRYRVGPRNPEVSLNRLSLHMRQKKLAGKVMHLVCLFISYLLTPLLLDIFRLSALDKDKCQTLFFLWPLKTGICDAYARKQGTSDLLPKVINFRVISCEITQKSAILTPTPFDFGETW